MMNLLPHPTIFKFIKNRSNEYAIKVKFTVKESRSCIVRVDAATAEEAISITKEELDFYHWENVESLGSEIEDIRVDECEMVKEGTK